jgi:hypothetical protein
MVEPKLADALAMPIHAAEKTRPLQRISLQGAAKVVLRQKSAGPFQCFNASTFQRFNALTRDHGRLTCFRSCSVSFTWAQYASSSRAIPSSPLR